MGMRRLIALVSALAIASVIVPPYVSPNRLSAQPTTRTVRPTSGSSSTFSNFGNAYDGNTGTTSAVALSAICSSTCTTLQTATATWSGVADGNHALSIEVHWHADAAVYAFAPAAAQVQAKMEYSLNAGTTWATLEEYTWTATSPACSNHGITCSDHVVTFSLGSSGDFVSSAAIQVRAYLGVRMTACWSCGAFGFDNAAGQIGVVEIGVIAEDCDIPIGETTDSLGWETSPRTIHNFQATLIPAGSNNFNGRTALEAPSGDTQDTCHFAESIYDPVDEIVTGGDWPVGSDNSYGPDSVGWDEVYATYYQANAQQLPCSVTGKQQMFISCQGTYLPYTKNELSYGVTSTTAFSRRQSNNQPRAWPP